ncbi:MAG: YceI family protein [Gemmatimonadota bacterium]|nr:YceI family protein [Gemmatimonadota bacterium]
MGRSSRTQLLKCSLALLAIAAPVRAQALYQLDESVSYVSLQGRASSFTIAGRSENLHGSMELADAKSKTVRGTIRFAFGSLSVAPRMFQREFYASFDAPATSEIIFTVDSVLPGLTAREWFMDGRLSIRGVARPVRFAGTAAKIGTRIVADGTSSIDVRHWGIEPKNRMFGLVQPSPEIRLSFSVSFVPVISLGAIEH